MSSSSHSGTVMITGATGGLGQSLACRLARERDFGNALSASSMRACGHPGSQLMSRRADRTMPETEREADITRPEHCRPPADIPPPCRSRRAALAD
jgi:NAD(P)-dependent dehydrogenase (short-subunit alcohol dehydrogenase family)